MNSEEEKKIRELWQTPSFSGSFSGLSNFQHALYLEKGIKISIPKLFSIMKSVPDFIIETHKVRHKIARRKMITHGYGDVFQAGNRIRFICYV